MLVESAEWARLGCLIAHLCCTNPRQAPLRGESQAPAGPRCLTCATMNPNEPRTLDYLYWKCHRLGAEYESRAPAAPTPRKVPAASWRVQKVGS